MRAAAILGLGCTPKDLKPFQDEKTVEWRMGLPAAADSADVILLFGGDGTIHRHLGQFVRLGLPLLVVPAGSGNDFARALGLHRVRDSLAAWRKLCTGAGNVRAIDLGIITPAKAARDSAPDSRYFATVAGVGIDGEVARRANEFPRWLRGHGGYLVSLVPTIFRFAPVRMRILSAGEDAAEWAARSDQPNLLAAFGNTPAYGGGMKIAPQAKMDDGLLDVCIVGGVNPFKLLGLLPSVYNSGRHLKIREVSYFQTSRVRAETERPLDVYADGEYVCQTPVEVGVQRGALKVVTP